MSRRVQNCRLLKPALVFRHRFRDFRKRRKTLSRRLQGGMMVVPNRLRHITCFLSFRSGETDKMFRGQPIRVFVQLRRLHSM